LYVGVKPTQVEHSLADVRLLAPVIPRSKIVAIGKNYAAHASEMGGETPAEPLMFLEPNTAVVGPGDAILYPPQSQLVSYEGELAVVVGRICRDVPAEQATDVIFGYTIANDVSARDQMFADGQWARAKGYDTFCPIGPVIETEIDRHGLDIQTYVDGEPRRHGNTRDMIHGIPEIVEFVSDIWTLLPGDLILTGTPAGLGGFVDGQTVEIQIQGIGRLVNPARNRV
jgi:2-keto-4-pentenoate hydratase/2-oxohepta-3-ene-1,7-dioic acid hydratase in catechol pathway